MIDFKKRLNSKDPIKIVNPIELYDKLDRKSEAGPLRPAQQYVLTEWFSGRYRDNNLIVKLHTGEGKTLIGLLMLLSKLNNGESPCLYICPNKFLVQQVANEATKFGIPFCLFEDGMSIPNDFLDGKKILITNVKKLFNGKTAFGLDNRSIPVGTILLDDSHACIESIEDAFTIRIRKNNDEDTRNPLYASLFKLFDEDLKSQGSGDYCEITGGDSVSIMQIPYWSWIDKSESISSLLYKNIDDESISFVWPLIKNQISECQAFISSKYIEIAPLAIDVSHFGSYFNAKCKVLMSATTQNDAFFIKTLKFNETAINNPLTDSRQKWSGEKMIIMPSLIDEHLLDSDIRRYFSKNQENARYGKAILVPSYMRAMIYKDLGADIITKENISEKVSALRKGEFKCPLVLANRYDGIDLPDDTCRILVIDSMPYFISLRDSYSGKCRKGSDLINIRLAQKIEQGLGRSVRGEKDYCVIIVIGSGIVRFLKSHSTTKYFSMQTRQQLKIAEEIIDIAKDDISPDSDPIEILDNLITQALIERGDWKEFYYERMKQMDNDPNDIHIDEVLSLESQVGDAINKKNYPDACRYVQKILDKVGYDNSERGWYLQMLARCQYYEARVESEKTQSSAFKLNSQLLYPKDGISYKKIEKIDGGRVERIKAKLKHYENYTEAYLQVTQLLEDLSFGKEADDFENALYEIGGFIGFVCQRPDKEYKKGADVLWSIKPNTYIIFECKNMVKEDRDTITKSEAGQMNTHCAWFASAYGKEADYLPVLIAPTNKLAYEADLESKVVIMRKNKLNSFKESIRNFLKEFINYDFEAIPNDIIQNAIDVHHLSIESLLVGCYYEKFKSANSYRG